MDILNNELPGIAEMVSIHLPFVVVYVVGKGDTPARVFEADPHEADPSEELCNSHVLCVHLCLCAFLHRLRAELKLEVIRDATLSGDASA